MQSTIKEREGGPVAEGGDVEGQKQVQHLPPSQFHPCQPRRRAENIDRFEGLLEAALRAEILQLHLAAFRLRVYLRLIDLGITQL